MVARPGPCNIDIRDGTMTIEEFLEKYASTRPVIIRDATNNDLFKSLARK